MIHLVGKCSVCGDETRYYVNSRINHDGVFHIIDGDKDIVYYLCRSCACEVHDFVEQLKKEYRGE